MSERAGLPEGRSCNGKVEQGVGCTTYLGSDMHLASAKSEDKRRREGLGFAVHLDSAAAIMLGHLQGQHGLGYEESSAIMRQGEL